MLSCTLAPVADRFTAVALHSFGFSSDSLTPLCWKSASFVLKAKLSPSGYRGALRLSSALTSSDFPSKMLLNNSTTDTCAKTHRYSSILQNHPSRFRYPPEPAGRLGHEKSQKKVFS